jgi:hypothetical protein
MEEMKVEMDGRFFSSREPAAAAAMVQVGAK